MTEKNYITEIHQSHLEWLRELDFYADELQIFRRQLEEISSKNTALELKMFVERFQNQFLIQKNELDLLKHDIRESESDLEKEVMDNPVALNRRKVADDGTLQDRMSTFTQLFQSMKKEFTDFVRKNF